MMAFGGGGGRIFGAAWWMMRMDMDELDRGRFIKVNASKKLLAPRFNDASGMKYGSTSDQRFFFVHRLFGSIHATNRTLQGVKIAG